jgi:DNA-directed RNA polymerase specialized sigma24 family protein
MTDDAELLRRYIENQSEAAFAELVERHLGFVYAVAARRLGFDKHLAEDVTQKVFIDLACKARSLSRNVVLTGWLFTSTRFTASRVVRLDVKLAQHEFLRRLVVDHKADVDILPMICRTSRHVDRQVGFAAGHA